MTSQQDHMHGDTTHKALDAAMNNAKEANHGFVDMQDFNHLSARMSTFEHNFSTLNSNVTHISNMMQQFISMNGSSVPAPPMMGGAATGASPSKGVAQVTETSLSKGSQEATTMFKNLKPPVFQGEEKDRNKDAVTTFLQKWRDLHQLHRTSDSIAAIEASLSLEGKAYKWWLSIDKHARPNTWGEFEVMFRREFLLENEKDRNWNAWDQCKMDNLTLSNTSLSIGQRFSNSRGWMTSRRCVGSYVGYIKIPSQGTNPIP